MLHRISVTSLRSRDPLDRKVEWRTLRGPAQDSGSGTGISHISSTCKNEVQTLFYTNRFLAPLLGGFKKWWIRQIVDKMLEIIVVSMDRWKDDGMLRTKAPKSCCGWEKRCLVRFLIVYILKSPPAVLSGSSSASAFTPLRRGSQQTQEPGLRWLWCQQPSDRLWLDIAWYWPTLLCPLHRPPWCSLRKNFVCDLV